MTKKERNLKVKTDEILQEIRIVLPGTEALLGFQFVIFFNPVFQNLPSELKNLHFATLILTMISTILLIAPVAFQQIGEEGHVTDKFLWFSRTMLSIAMGFLLLALAGDAFLAASTINTGHALAATVSIAVFVIGISLWYIYVLFHRNGKKG